MLNIERACKEEIESIAELAVLLWPHHSKSELIDELSDSMNNPKELILIAKDNQTNDKTSRIISFAHASLRYDYVEGTESSPVGYLEAIYVLEQYRNKSVARFLVEEIMQWARTFGCLEMASDCAITNIDSYNFHLKIGFEEAGRIICFKKKLNDKL